MFNHLPQYEEDTDADFSVLTKDGEWKMKGSFRNNAYSHFYICQIG